MTFLFANIGYFYIAIYLVTALYCVIAQNQIAFASAVFLSFLAGQGWIMDLWLNPDNMAVYHLALITLMYFAFHCNHGTRLLKLTFLMLIADCIWIVLPEMNLTRNTWNLPHSLFWWQSSLNILFFIACVITLKSCYDTRLVNRYQARVEHDKFIAFESDKIRV